jgi:hypothetical protein
MSGVAALSTAPAVRLAVVGSVRAAALRQDVFKSPTIRLATHRPDHKGQGLAREPEGEEPE